MLSVVVKFQLFSLLILNISSNFVSSYDVNGFCGNPGKPFNSRLVPDKDYYNDGEEVTFQCDEFWNNLHFKKCVKGKWIGNQFRCGKTLNDNDLNYIKAEDISTELPEILFEYNITLLPNYKFPNSFLSSRYPITFQVESGRKIRWTLKIEKPISLPFFRINFQFINITVEESKKINITANAIVSPHRTCIHTHRNSKQMWRFGTKVELFFECDANSEKDYFEDEKNPGNEIIIETQTTKEITYKLIAIFLAEAYGTSDEPICGEPETRFGQWVRILWPQRVYSIECLDSMYYLSKDNPDLPETVIHMQNCTYDMKWKGTYPICAPKVVCPLPSTQQNQINSMVKISQVKNVYYFNETQFSAIDGTKLKYECNDSENQVLLGDAIHRCKNSLWIGRTPHCLDMSQFKDKKVKNRAVDNNGY